MPNIVCLCKDTTGQALECHGGDWSIPPQNWAWYGVHNSNCCPGGSRANGVHVTCQGHSCGWLEQTTCTGSVVPGIGVDGEEEMMTGGSQPQLTDYDGGDGGVGFNIVDPVNKNKYTPINNKTLIEKLGEEDTTYYTPSGKEWLGSTHTMAGGRLMSGNPHGVEGSGVNGESEILTKVDIIYLTPSGKQWCGSRHKSMLGTLMSGMARDKFGSGPDGKSEILGKRLIGGDGKGLEEYGYKLCKTDDQQKVTWDCTSIGCMPLPTWWPMGQFSGPNAYMDCMSECWSWKCGDLSIDWAWLSLDFCFCLPVEGTGATQTYPTYGLCQAATQTDPCCTDDYNTYNCTLNGCEVHTGPGVGTYNQAPYALYQCQQDCVAWGCHEVHHMSANTTTGHAYTVETTATTHTSGSTGYAYTWTQDTGTTVTGDVGTDLCIMVYYDTSSMGQPLINQARQAITQWRNQAILSGGVLSAWTGTFLQENSYVGVGGWEIGNEVWLRWPSYTMEHVEDIWGPSPCLANPLAPNIEDRCLCRNILSICLIDECNSTGGNQQYSYHNNWNDERNCWPDGCGQNQGAWCGDVSGNAVHSLKDNYDYWTNNGGRSQTLVYAAKSKFTGSTNTQNQLNVYRTFGTQVFLATQGNRFDTANNGNTLQYNAITGNVEKWLPAGSTVWQDIFGSPEQTSIWPEIWNQRPVFDFTNWIETTGPAFGLPGYSDWTNPFLNEDPLEDYEVYGIYDRRGYDAFTVDKMGADIANFIQQFPLTSVTYAYISAATITSDTSTWQTFTSHTYTAITSNTVTVSWTQYDACLSAQTLPYADYPYLHKSLCVDMDCEVPGWSCGVNGCFQQLQSNATGMWWYDDDAGVGLSKCKASCRSWTCSTRTGALEPEGGWAQVPVGGTAPQTCEGTIEDQMGTPLSLYHPVTGNTYDFVSHCFNVFQPFQGYPPNQGVLGGGLWDNTGTSWVQGVTTTTIQNGLVVHDLGGGNCKTWHPYPHVPGRITKLSEFKLVDLNGNTLYRHLDGSIGVQAVDIMNELSTGTGQGWGNFVGGTYVSPDWPTGIPDSAVGPGVGLDRLILYGNNTTGDNNVKKFTVEVSVFGCPCEQFCNCKLIPGIDPSNPDIYPIGSPNAYNKCEEECCKKVKTWKCPDHPEIRSLMCNNCPNGGGCYDPLDGSGPYSTQNLCEDKCAVSFNCYSATPISAVTIYSANTTCEHVNYLLPYSGIPTTYFQQQEPTRTYNGLWSTAQNNFSGWTWGMWHSLNVPHGAEAYKFSYGHQSGLFNQGGVSNAFEAFIYIFDEANHFHNIDFNKIGFWTGEIWDADIGYVSHTCEYPSPQGNKQLGVMEAFENTEFSVMYCIDYELRVNKRPWTTTEDPMINNTPHPLNYSYLGKWLVQGVAEMCGRRTGVHVTTVPQSAEEDHTMTHSLADGSGIAGQGHYGTRSPYYRYKFKSVKDLKDKIIWMYSQPDFVDNTYFWHYYNRYPNDPVNYPDHYGQSRNQTNLKSGACTYLGKELAHLFTKYDSLGNVNEITCYNFQNQPYNVPHPSNGLKPGLKLKDFWIIGMFRNFAAKSIDRDWYFTPANNYTGFKRKGEESALINSSQPAYRNMYYCSFMTLNPSDHNVYPGIRSIGTVWGSSVLGPSGDYGLIGRSTSLFGNAQPVFGGTIYNYFGPQYSCMCEMPCYCDIINGDLGDYEYENQCHSNCCPDNYYYICCQPDTNPPPTSTPPFQVSCLYSISNCQCPDGSHQVPCPWIVGGGDG